jgi:hypothetical protein
VKRPLLALGVVAAAIAGAAFFVFQSPDEGPKPAAAEPSAPPPKPAAVVAEPAPALAPTATGKLTGRVHRRGAGVPGARVQVKGTQLTETVTKDDGRYELSGLAPGDYLVWATFQKESSSVAGPVRIDAQSQVDLELLPSASLEGVVIDAHTREPLEHAAVASTAGATVTDHAGRFRFDVLPAGETWIEASAPGHLKRTTWLGLPGAHPHSGLTMALDPSARIEGRVVRGTASVVGAQVWGEAQVSERAGQVCGPVTSGADGSFALDCADGPLELAASGPSGSRVEGPRVHGEAGKTRSGVRIELGEELNVDGIVLAQDTPLAGASVTLFDARSQRQVNGAVSGPDGKFHVPSVSVGSYVVQVSAGALNAQVGPFEQTGEGIPWTVVVPKGGTLNGRVEPPTAGVRVGWRSGDWAGAPATATTDEKGKFHFDSVPAGVLLVEAEGPGGVASARAHAGEEVVLKLASAQLKVTVIDEKNLPVTDYLLIVEPLSSGSTKRIPVLSPEGQFEGVIGTGKWRVTATAQGFSTSEPRDVELSAPQTVQLTLKSADQIRAVVLDANTRAPIAGAEVTFKAFVPGRWYAPARLIGPFVSDGRGEVRAAVPEAASVEARLGARQMAAPLSKVPRDNGGRLELPLPPESGGPPPKSAEVQEYEGVGMQLAQDGPRVYVWQTFEGGPAEAAGILRGDTIVAVDGFPARAPADSIIPRIQGPSGTAVTLTMQRDGETMDFVVRRRAIRF